MATRKTTVTRPKLPNNPLPPSMGPPPGATALPPYVPPAVSRTVTRTPPKATKSVKTKGKK